MITNDYKIAIYGFLTIYAFDTVARAFGVKKNNQNCGYWKNPYPF